MVSQPASNDPARTDGRRKRGPRTAAGKAAVRLNAVRHGITSPQVPIPGVEDADAWLAFRQAVIDDIAPVGAVEEALTERVAELHWRLRRIAPYEAELIAVAPERVEDDYAKRLSFSGPRTIAEAEAAVDAAREARAAIESVGMAFLMRARVVAALDEQLASAEEKLAAAANEIDRSRRERLLPPERQMTNLMKYEAHRGRQLAQALTHLEALQARRNGAPIPLARLHVSASA
jgi:hypothetical protein